MKKTSPARLPALLLATLFLCPALSHAAPPTTPISDKVPARALFYARWAGANNVPPEFADTKFSSILTSLELEAWSKSVLPTLLPPNAQNAPFANDLLDLGRTIIAYAWNNESIIYSLGKGTDENLDTKPQFCFLIRFPSNQAATAAEHDISDRLSQILQGNSIPNLRLFAAGDAIAIVANDTTPSPLEDHAAKLTDSPTFQDAFKAAGEGPIQIYVDMDKVWPLVDEGNEEKPDYNRNMKIAGLKQAKAIALSAGPQTDKPNDKLWTSHTVILSPTQGTAPRTGLFGALASTRPTDPALYSGIPKSISSANVATLDLPDILSRIKTEGEEYKHGFPNVVDAWVGLIGGVLNVKLPEMMSNLGKDFALVTLKNSKGDGYEVVLINKPANAEQTEGELFHLTEGISRILVTQRPELPPLKVARSSTTGEQQGTPPKISRPPISTATIGKAAFSWAAVNGYLYIAPPPAKGDSEEVLAHVLSKLAEGPLSSDSSFASLKEKLAAPPAASTSYFNVADALLPTYENWATLIKRARPRMNPIADKLPIPSALTLAEQASPAISATWTDASGFHLKTLTPYPGAEAFSPIWLLAVGSQSYTEKLKEIRNSLRPTRPSPAP